MKLYLDASASAPFFSRLICSNDPLLHKLPLIFRFYCNKLLFSQTEKMLYWMGTNKHKYAQQRQS